MAFKKVGELWMKKDKKGRTYLDGYIRGGKHLTVSAKRNVKLAIFPNELRQVESDADYYVYHQTFDKPRGGKG